MIRVGVNLSFFVKQLLIVGQNTLPHPRKVKFFFQRTEILVTFALCLIFFIFLQTLFDFCCSFLEILCIGGIKGKTLTCLLAFFRKIRFYIPLNDVFFLLTNALPDELLILVVHLSKFILSTILKKMSDWLYERRLLLFTDFFLPIVQHQGRNLIQSATIIHIPIFFLAFIQFLGLRPLDHQFLKLEDYRALIFDFIYC